MRRLDRFLTLSMLLSCCLLSTYVQASEQEMYHFLPANVVAQQVKNNLHQHGVDVTQLRVSADNQGVVQVSGTVASKLEAENITRWAMHTQGVYGVLGELQYSEQPLDSSAM